MLGSQKTGNLFILKAKTMENKQKVPVHFTVAQKNDETGKYEVISKVNSVRGKLTTLKTEEKDFEGVKYTAVKVVLEDEAEDETYLLDLRMNGLTRGLLNSLLGMEKADDINISVYENKGGYASVSVWQNDKLVPWKFTIEEQPKVDVHVKKNGEKIYDSSEVEEFFINAVADFQLPTEVTASSETRTEAAPKAKAGKGKGKKTKTEEVYEDIDLVDLEDIDLG